MTDEDVSEHGSFGLIFGQIEQEPGQGTVDSGVIYQVTIHIQF